VVEAKKKFFIWKFLKQMTRGNVWCSCQAKGWKILNRDINICKEKKMFLTFIACLVARRPAQPPMQCLTSVLFRDLSGRCVKPTANETACPYVFREATSIFKKTSSYLFSVKNSMPQKFCVSTGRSSLSFCSVRKPVLTISSVLFLRKYTTKIYKFV
jgi:hypothetical protein